MKLISIGIAVLLVASCTEEKANHTYIDCINRMEAISRIVELLTEEPVYKNLIMES